MFKKNPKKSVLTLLLLALLTLVLVLSSASLGFAQDGTTGLRRHLLQVKQGCIADQLGDIRSGLHGNFSRCFALTSMPQP